MKIPFFKYHGAGNDFIIINESQQRYFEKLQNPQAIIAAMCERRFGIGADGLMLLRQHPDFNFQMIYYNSDGRPSTMCGNGGRCLVAFAADEGIIGQQTSFIAIDGAHKATILQKQGTTHLVSLQMTDVKKIDPMLNGYFLNTGSPHYVVFEDEIENLDVFNLGRKLRHNPAFGIEGTNINFVRFINNTLYIRTYERGVEDETLACGTGITAAAIAAYHSGTIDFSKDINVKALGGDLSVSFDAATGGSFINVFLQGPATRVFNGEADI
jgi:diaminopimelate epimerase